MLIEYKKIILHSVPEPNLRSPGGKTLSCPPVCVHDDVIKWKHFPRYWPFVRGIHRSPVNTPHKGQWRGALMFTLICARINGWVNNREAGDLRRYRAHYDVIVMAYSFTRFYWIDHLLRALRGINDSSFRSVLLSSFERDHLHAVFHITQIDVPIWTLLINMHEGLYNTKCNTVQYYQRQHHNCGSREGDRLP